MVVYAIENYLVWDSGSKLIVSNPDFQKALGEIHVLRVKFSYSMRIEFIVYR